VKVNVFKKEMSDEEILNKISEDAANTAWFNTGSCYLAYKLQQQSMDEQNKQNKEILKQQNIYNRKQLFWSRMLVWVTLALVVATLLLYFAAR
jgi:hypothetical protein